MKTFRNTSNNASVIVFTSGSLISTWSTSFLGVLLKSVKMMSSFLSTRSVLIWTLWVWLLSNSLKTGYLPSSKHITLFTPVWVIKSMSKWYVLGFPYSGDNNVTRGMTSVKRWVIKVVYTNQNYKTEISVQKTTFYLSRNNFRRQKDSRKFCLLIFIWE